MTEADSSPKYPTDYATIKKLADRSIVNLAEYVDTCNTALQHRTAIRCQRCVPVIAFCGPGRCGKDSAAAWLAANYAVKYSGSVSQAILPLVANAVDRPDAEVYAERHEHRDFWFAFCNALREEDPAFLARCTLAQNDVVAGIRASAELEAVVGEGLVDLTAWVSRDVPSDPTLEYYIEDCDIAIDNSGTRIQFYRRLRRLAEALKLPPRR